MAGISVAVKNRVVAAALIAFCGATYSYTMYRMKSSVSGFAEEFSSSTPAKDAGK